MSSDAWQPKISARPAGLLGPRFARVIEAEGEVEVTPVVWRQVGAAAVAAGKAEAASPDLAAQLQRMEQQCEQRVKEARAAGLREGETAARAPPQPKCSRCSRNWRAPSKI